MEAPANFDVKIIT